MIVLDSFVVKCEYAVDKDGESLIIYTSHPDLGDEEIRFTSMQMVELNARFLRIMKAMIGYKLLSVIANDIDGSCKFNFGIEEPEITLWLQNIIVKDVLNSVVT